MARGISQPGQIHLRIIEVMKRFPEGISGLQISLELEREGFPPEDLGHLGRRIREFGQVVHHRENDECADCQECQASYR